jgi:hypothetical protein
MSALMDVWHAIQAVVTSADYITLGIAVVVVLVAGFTIERLGSLVSATVLALIVFAALEFVRAVAIGHQDAMAFATTDWHAFVDLRMLTFVAYFVVFGVLIALVNVIRSAIR